VPPSKPYYVDAAMENGGMLDDDSDYDSQQENDADSARAASTAGLEGKDCFQHIEMHVA
jgi:hypothetical protein